MTDLNEFYRDVVAGSARCGYSGSRKCIGNDADGGASPRAGNDETRDGYCGSQQKKKKESDPSPVILRPTKGLVSSRPGASGKNLHRLGSRRQRAGPSSGRLATTPMSQEEEEQGAPGRGGWAPVREEMKRIKGKRNKGNKDEERERGREGEREREDTKITRRMRRGRREYGKMR